MKKRTARILIDVLLTVLIIFEMAIQFTGEYLHEIMGIVFFFTIAAHLVLQATWIKGTTDAALHGRLKGRRKRFAIMNSLLAISALVLGISSIAISDLLFQAGLDWTWGTYEVWEAIHAISSYALCAVVAVHLTLHWVFLSSILKIPYNPSRREVIGASIHSAASLAAVSLGVIAIQDVLRNPPVQSIASSYSPLQNITTSEAQETLQIRPTITDTIDNGQNIPIQSPDQESEAEPVAADQESSRKHGRNSSNGDIPAEDNISIDYYAEYAEESYAEEQYTQEIVYEEPPVVYEDYTYEVTPEPESWYSYEEPVVETSYNWGICTLCRKQCSLSNPRCNKPYQQGLI
ncbi:MAG: cytochrome b/b6 domain-containing protein [Coriobacteriales bacterium]|nr:cytochrome b/b6 domain-containing protein [Coriobacteriales bacterium]